LAKETTGIGHNSKAALKVELRSMTDANKFQTHSRGKRTLCSTILKLGWAEFKAKANQHTGHIWKMSTIYWEFNKPNPTAPPQSLRQRACNTFPKKLVFDVFDTLHPGRLPRPAQLPEQSIQVNASSLNVKLPAKAASALEYSDALLDMLRKLLDALHGGSD